jgi:hypothetical protein
MLLLVTVVGWYRLFTGCWYRLLVQVVGTGFGTGSWYRLLGTGLVQLLTVTMSDRVTVNG